MIDKEITIQNFLETLNQNFLETLNPGYYYFKAMSLLKDNEGYICMTNYFYEKFLIECGYTLCDDFFKYGTKIIIDDSIGVKLISKAEWREKQINSILED